MEMTTLQWVAMFDLAYDAKHSVLLSRFSGAYSPADIALRDNAVRRFVAKNGLVRGLMDFSAVDSIDVPLDLLIQRAHQPGILTGQQRVIVATSEPAYTFNRLVAAHQLFARKAEPTLVRSVGDAFGVLRMIDPAFSSIGFDKADHLDRVLHDVLHQLAEVVRARSLDNEIVEATLQRVVGRAVSAPVIGHITLSEVLNVSLRSKVLRESGIRSECCDCGARRPLSWMSVSVGRVTTYSCPACGSWLVKLSQIGNTLAADASGYVMGGFEVVSRVTLDIWGVKLPKTES
jgi:hypothetical protein